MNTPITMKKRKAVSLLLLLSAAMLLCSALFFFLKKDPKSTALSLLFLLILLLLPRAERWLRLRIPAPSYACLLFLLLGSYLGSCYNFYMKISFWDILLHGLSGPLFACIGYAFCKLLFPNNENSKDLPYLLVGIAFSLSIALLWEVFEAGATYIFSVDMQEDTLLTSFKSFYLSGTHSHVTRVENIRETVIRFENGEALCLPGYLDLGLADTLSDMAVCLGGNLVFALLFPLDRLLGGRILPHLLPKTQ